jgi:hypothetical protein
MNFDFCCLEFNSGEVSCECASACIGALLDRNTGRNSYVGLLVGIMIVKVV